MNRIQSLFAAVALSILMSVPAWADPGVLPFTNTATAKTPGAPLKLVKVGGGTLVFSFSSSTDDSVAFRVVSPVAHACFDTNIASAVLGANRVDIRFANNPSNPVTVSSFVVPGLVPDVNCVDLITGTYWLDPTIAGGLSSQVTITGRAF